MTTGLLMPSRLTSASYFPGPHELNTALTAGGRTGERARIAPTFRSRFGSPSSRRPTPGATELSTVEWHRAHVMPSRLMCRSAVTWASTPTTASRRSSSTVVAALVRSAPARKPGGSGAASTLRPSASAVAGDTPVSITSFKCSVSVQNGSSPKVQCRKMYWPCAGTFPGGPAMRSPPGGSGRPAGATASGLSLQASRSATSATKRIRPPDVTGIQWRSITYVRRFYNERLSSLTRTGRSAPSCGTNATRGEEEGEGGATRSIKSANDFPPTTPTLRRRYSSSGVTRTRLGVTMNLYSLSLAIGAVGLLAMALTGLGRHGHGHGHVGSKLGHARASHAPSPGRGTHHSHGGTARATATAWLWSLTSPRVLFSLLIGFGTTGVLVRGALAGPLAFGAAMAGGVLFEQLLVGPVWNFLMRFASAPALTLESCLQDEVRAATGFDADGHGLVTAEVDGQVVQLLATLRAEDRSAGVRIRAGDLLRVEDVD